MKPPANATAIEQKLWEQLEGHRLPRHVAIIMDGNGRWATQRGLSRAKGHKAGIRAVRQALDTVLHLGIGAITIFAFSTENWGRPPAEVSVLMTLLRQFLRIEVPQLMAKGIRVRILGDTSRLPEAIQKGVAWIQEQTEHNATLQFNIALNYGGRDEILRATRSLVKKQLTPEAITEEVFSSNLDTAGIPDPDLLIRTSGELRVSNFLLWQLAYAELYFTDVLWPEFDTPQMLHALLDYQNRARRFGGIDGN